jgi:hypothetical protein
MEPALGGERCEIDEAGDNLSGLRNPLSDFENVPGGNGADGSRAT